MSRSDFDGDAGSPLPNFTGAGHIELSTIAPALGVSRGKRSPDYLDYDQKGRGVVVTMFANTGASYLIGTTFGGFYGLREGLSRTPSSRFKVKLNSVLNHCGRHGSRVGNTVGVLSIMYSLYEGFADWVSLIFPLKDCADVYNSWFLNSLVIVRVSFYLFFGSDNKYNSKIWIALAQTVKFLYHQHLQLS